MINLPVAAFSLAAVIVSGTIFFENRRLNDDVVEYQAEIESLSDQLEAAQSALEGFVIEKEVEAEERRAADLEKAEKRIEGLEDGTVADVLREAIGSIR